MTGYTDVKATYNFADLPDPITQDGSGYYDISYTILTAASVLTQSYGSNSDYYDPSGVQTEEASSFSGPLSTAQTTAIADILLPSGYYDNMFSSVAPVDFSSGANGAIAIGQVDDSTAQALFINPDTSTYDNHVAALTFNGVSPTEANYGDVWLNANYTSGWSTVTAGSVQFLAIMHELGHSMGLDHPTGGETQQYTIMSNTPDPDVESGVYPAGLQLYDVLALQSIYGVNWSTRSDDTEYGVGHGFAASASQPFIYTIWDGAGTDIIDASGYDHAVEIDLRQGHFSSIGYKDSGSQVNWDDAPVDGQTDPGNVAIAYHTIIENAWGTSGDDVLIGNEWNNVLFGGDGNDTIIGDGNAYDGDPGYHDPNSFHSPTDVSGLIYEWGPDGVAPATNLSGDDVLIGGKGNDTFYGGLGNDVIHGGYVQSDIDSVISGWDPASQFSGCITDISYADDGSDTVDYSYLNAGSGSESNPSLAGGNLHVVVTTTSSSITVDKDVGSSVVGTDTLFSIEHIIGTPYSDTFNGSAGSASTLFYVGGGGHDTFNFNLSVDRGDVVLNEPSGSGLDTINLTNTSGLYFLGGDGSGYFSIALSDTLSGGYLGTPLFEAAIGTSSEVTAGTGVNLLYLTSGAPISMTALQDYFDANPAYPVLASDLRTDVYNYEFTAGSGGVGAGGDTKPTYDGLGNVESMQINPLVGGSPIDYGIADVVDNPLVLTYFSESFSGGTYTSTTSWQTYEKAFDFIAGISASDVRLTASGSQGDAALTINIDSLGFSLTISDFETGNTISGIEVYNSTLHGLIQDASGSTLVSTGTNTFGGSYLTLTGLDVDTSASVNVTYFLEALNFASGSSIDLTAPITFTGSDSGDSLTGLDGRTDTIYGMNGDDTIYSYGGNDTLIGGAGNDDLYGGTGDDTYVFAAGWGSDTVHENTGEGTDTLHFTGIAPSDIRMYTDAYGDLHLVQISDPSNSVTVNAGVTGSGDSESAVGSYVESVTFDSSYSTTWDLTGGLNLTGDNSGDYLYGTAYADTITGGTGADVIYGNGGNDTIIGGAGDDYLYGGTGNDTYVFSAGFGNATVHENTGEGTDTIHFTGINPADIRLWTDAYGNLMLQDTSDPSHSITVVAGVTGSGTSESAIGSYVESVTFDSSYSTTWDLTGGLHITGDNSGDYLYGTAYDDTITGGTGADVIYGNGGNDTIIGGAGDDYLYGGTGNDTYVFSSGFGNATVHENLSEGTDAIHFTGINPADIRLWTDAYGNLMLQDTSDTSHSITVNAGVTGSGTSESAIGSYVESVTFDSSYSTTWDLTGGLHITGDNSGDFLYGTAYGDTITSGTGADVIYGNGGNDTIIGGAGDDYLYGGTGNDTYVFSSGFGNATVHENLSEGTDTIHFSGIDPADIRLWTDAYGNLMLQDTSDTSHSITVNAGVTGDNTSESTVGSYVESVTFDSGYSTTWDLTGGLHITGDNSGDYLYGTAYGDTITGGTGDDVIYANAGDDVLYGAGGTDQLTGGPGADTFLFKAATAETGVATIMDFNTSDGDKIDLADVISTYDPATMAIANFVQIATSGSDTQVKVDTDGSGTSYTQIATIQGVTGLNLADLITDGNLIVHHS